MTFAPPVPPTATLTAHASFEVSVVVRPGAGGGGAGFGASPPTGWDGVVGANTGFRAGGVMEEPELLGMSSGTAVAGPGPGGGGSLGSEPGSSGASGCVGRTKSAGSAESFFAPQPCHWVASVRPAGSWVREAGLAMGSADVPSDVVPTGGVIVPPVPTAGFGPPVGAEKNGAPGGRT